MRSNLPNGIQEPIVQRVDVDGGDLRARVLDADGKPYEGFDWADCTAVKGELLNFYPGRSYYGTQAGPPLMLYPSMRGPEA